MTSRVGRIASFVGDAITMADVNSAAVVRPGDKLRFSSVIGGDDVPMRQGALKSGIAS